MGKRIFDLTLSVTALLLAGWFIIIAYIIASADTRCHGIFTQKRIGQHGLVFKIYKLRTIDSAGKISRIGNFLRNYKIDELPQLLNVIKGDMSLVGPRPDLPGYYDELKGEARKLLQLKPGITGPASLKYSDEEKLLLQQENPGEYNDNVIFPDKVKINMEYLEHQSLLLDMKILLYTILRIRS